ncbi:anthranilate phosphoribosyltransferase [Longirhabdus pacifica]|uniref:anthranilate phosphoribosyltransferase n=1 Tax=Longirhabdus pacifica TaxID=2305227 RepID=UPI0010089FDD|nr:anthranilate phosphoribosyltransferase [Longirhabdus pacifica]
MMRNLLKEVGRGKRGAKDLSYEQATTAAQLIIDHEATPAQIGAFLVAERIKMQTVEELQAFIHTYRRYTTSFEMENSFDCAGPYDGRKTSFFATLPTAFVLAANDVPVTLHASPTMPPKWGITLYDVMQELNIVLDKQKLMQSAKETGFLFVPTEEWCPPLQDIRNIRTELGLRTLYNTIEKFMLVSKPDYMAAGVFHGTIFERVAYLMSQNGIKKGLVTQGMEGSEDVNIEKPTRAVLVDNQQHDIIIIDPATYGLQMEVPAYEWSAALQAEKTLHVLQGKADLAFHHMVILNSGIRLWIADKANSIEQGIYMAKQTLESGEAWTSFQSWQQKTTMQPL